MSKHSRELSGLEITKENHQMVSFFLSNKGLSQEGMLQSVCQLSHDKKTWVSLCEEKIFIRSLHISVDIIQYRQLTSPI